MQISIMIFKPFLHKNTYLQVFAFFIKQIHYTPKKYDNTAINHTEHAQISQPTFKTTEIHRENTFFLYS